jgi:hypothetical protein
MVGRRQAKRQAPGITTGVEECLHPSERTKLAHGGQRPVGGMVYRRSKALPQIGQSKASFGKVGEARESLSGRGAWVSDSSSSRSAARSRRWEEPKKPK